MIRLARPEDDEDLRAILRENSMAGDIALTFEREPNYFIAARVEASEQQIVVGEDPVTKTVVGMGSRSIRTLYINGQARPFGYLSQFRISPEYRAMRRGFTQAWQMMKELHQDGRTPFYYTSIIEDNLPARRLLTRGLPGLPTYLEYARMHTLALYSRRRKKHTQPPGGLRIQRGSAQTQAAILDCLQRNLPRYQFAPHWDAALLFSPQDTPGLSPEDFFIALDGDIAVGCIALWDQGAFKQTVVRGYTKRVRYFRWAINLTAGPLGLPTLPREHAKLKHAYASHLAVDRDDPGVYDALLRTLYNHAVEEGFLYFVIGLCDHHPFLERTRDAYAHIDYPSLLYLVHWDADQDPRAVLDDRLPAPEMAIL